MKLLSLDYNSIERMLHSGKNCLSSFSPNYKRSTVRRKPRRERRVLLYVVVVQQGFITGKGLHSGFLLCNVYHLLQSRQERPKSRQ